MGTEVANRLLRRGALVSSAPHEAVINYRLLGGLALQSHSHVIAFARTLADLYETFDVGHGVRGTGNRIAWIHIAGTDKRALHRATRRIARYINTFPSLELIP